MNGDGRKQLASDQKPHSSDYFGDTRDFWWNPDFLGLMSERWKLSDVRKALDVGCGIGHWGRCLAPFLPNDCALIGVDREIRSLEEARTKSSGCSNALMSFHQGEAERLPFADSSFDMVTCQTLLIHVKDPVAVIREMIRVLVPGGLLVIVEPNNIASNAYSLDLQKPISEQISLLEFQMICERGKMTLGEGFNSAGTFVPGWLSESGVEHIDSYLSDKTTMLMPPYASAQERAMIREAKEMNARQFWIWDRSDTLRYFLAGGGAPDAFDRYWTMALAKEKELLDDVERGHARATFTPVCLLVSGRKKIASAGI